MTSLLTFAAGIFFVGINHAEAYRCFAGRVYGDGVTLFNLSRFVPLIRARLSTPAEVRCEKSSSSRRRFPYVPVAVVQRERDRTRSTAYFRAEKFNIAESSRRKMLRASTIGT